MKRLMRSLQLRHGIPLVRCPGLLALRVRGRTLQHHLIILASTMVKAVAPNPIRVNGLKLYYDPRKYFFLSFFSPQGYEPDVKGLVRQLVKPGMKVIDAGAAIGYFTLLLAKAVGPAGHVWAFEPEPSNYAVLKKNVAANGYEDRVTLVPKALSNKSGFAQLFLGEWHIGAHSLFTGSGVSQLSLTVEKTTLDEFFSEDGMTPISLIKMDIEGAELAALEGMAELSSRSPDLKLIIEFNPTTLASAGVSPEELPHALRSLGFSRFSIMSDRLKIVRVDDSLFQESRHGANLLCEKG